MAFKYRDHRGGLAESLETTRQFKSKEELFIYLKSILDKYCVDIDVNKTTIKPYGFDGRINWNSHIVHLEGWGVFGFTDKQI